MKSKQRWYQRHQLFNQSLPPALMPWLFDSSSLTARLIDLCQHDFAVQVISQSWQLMDVEDATAMSLSSVRSGLIRQVLLCCDGQPLVYARTVIPVTTAHGALRRYCNMGNRPLGAMLFADRTMRREAVQVTELPAAHPVNQYSEVDEAIWGRRSVFRVAKKPILVSEYFLPELISKSR